MVFISVGGSGYLGLEPRNFYMYWWEAGHRGWLFFRVRGIAWIWGYAVVDRRESGW